MTSADIEQLYREHQTVLVRWLTRLVRCEETAEDLDSFQKPNILSFPKNILQAVVVPFGTDIRNPNMSFEAGSC